MRSRVGYWIGGGLVAAGVLGAALWLIGSFATLGDTVDDFERVPVPGAATIQLEARKYVVYYEGPGADEAVPPLEIAIADGRTGSPLAIAAYGGSLTYSFSGHEGSALATVSPPQAGAYAIRTRSGVRASGASVALGRSLAWPILRTILGALAIAGLVAGAGITLLVVTAVRRSRTSRAQDRNGREK